MYIGRVEERYTHHFFDFSLGAGFRGMRNKALIGYISQRAEKPKKEGMKQIVKCNGKKRTF